MTTRKVSKFLAVHAMATAAVAATVLSPPISVRAAILMENPAQISPDTDPAMWDDTTEVWIAKDSDQNASMILNGQGGITTVNIKNTIIGKGAHGTGELTVTGNGTTWNSDTLYLGYTNGSNGFLYINDGASVTANRIDLSCPSGSSRYAQSTGSITLTNNSTLTGTGNVVYIGGVNGTGIIDVLSGSTFNSKGIAIVGGATAGTSYGFVTVDGEGSTWNHDGNIEIALFYETSIGELNISNGGLVAAKRLITLQGTASINFNGGTLKPLVSEASFIHGKYHALTLTDTASRPALTMQVDDGLSVGVTQVFTGTGGIAKTGGGTFTLNGNQAYTGLTDVKDGTFMGKASFAGSLAVRDGGIYAPGGASNADKVWTTNIAKNYTQNSGGTLMLDVGKNGSDMLVVGGNVSLGGILELVFNGKLDADYYVLIDNLGSKAVNGFFSDILFGNDWVELTYMVGTGGGGWFMVDDVTYYLTYAGDSATGSIYGGNDVILSLTGSGSYTPAVPEPASLSL
ncbi:MAG: hypothetical protein FWD53_11080, partial [Phycisphaerales bacterium]|nr:hypothetical protein [Phycisphaerales bacterium]